MTESRPKPISAVEEAIEPALAAAETHAEELGFDPLLIVAVIAIGTIWRPGKES